MPVAIWFDELAIIIRWTCAHIDADDGGSVYLRLTTRVIPQPIRDDNSWQDDAVNGGYWIRPPAKGAKAALIYCGAIAPEALLAWEMLIDGSPAALSWIGSVKGMRLSPLGTEVFGQTGDLPDTYRLHRLDSDAILDAAAELFL